MAYKYGMTKIHIFFKSRIMDCNVLGMLWCIGVLFKMSFKVN